MREIRRAGTEKRDAARRATTGDEETRGRGETSAGRDRESKNTAAEEEEEEERAPGS